MSGSYNSFRVAQQQIREAAVILGLDEATTHLLLWPQREFQFTMPVRMDNDQVKVFHGYRIQYNSARGPAKGGIRFHPGETADTIRALACWMACKTAVLDLPLGGGKGGVVCNPKTLSAREIESLSRAYIRAAAPYLGHDKDIPAPDMYTNPQIMAWMMDEYSIITGYNVPGVITGKPIPLGGSAGRGDATAKGGMYCIREAAKSLDIDLTQATVAVQGYGNAGQFAHKLITEMFGVKVVAVSDSGGGIYNPQGLDFAAVVAHKKGTGSVQGFPGAKNITNEELLELDATLLVPAALENQIGAWNAGNVKARILAELANGPTTPDADAILYKNGVFVIPDFLCNAGGVTVSYFEQVQNAYDYYWTAEEVYEHLDQKMTAAFHAVHEMAKKYRVHNRTAAYLVSVSRVAEACKLRGWV